MNAPLDVVTGRHATDWEAPGAYEVVPGVHRIPLPLPGDGLRAVNVYSVSDGAGGAVLVDSGWALELARERLESALASIELDLGCITDFLVTHVHRDHYTQALVVRREFGSRVALGEGERASLAALTVKAEEIPSALAAELRRTGAGDLVDELLRAVGATGNDTGDVWEQPDEWLSGGQLVQVGERCLRVIATPGHTSGHVVFHDVDHRLLFAGDHLLPHITPSVGFEMVPVRSALTDYLSSLRASMAADDARLLPAHGPVAPSVHERALELLAHHGARLDSTYAAVRAGATSGYDVARSLPWTRRGRRFTDLDIFNRMLAVNETVAHLEFLAEQGRVVRETAGGRTRYVG